MRYNVWLANTQCPSLKPLPTSALSFLHFSKYSGYLTRRQTPPLSDTAHGAYLSEDGADVDVRA
jgi:hypothetical protein